MEWARIGRRASDGAMRKLQRRSSGGRLSARFRRMNILIFAAAFCVMTAVMATLLSGVVARLSSDFAKQHALSSAEALSAHISREIDIVSYIANSAVFIEWMSDEGDEDKMGRALSDMAGLVGELYSFNMYIVFADSQKQYRVVRDYETGAARFVAVDVLNANNPNDAWYFECIGSDKTYVLDVGIDQIMSRKRVWLDYNVVLDGVLLGVISTGLEFSHMVGELFSQYEGGNMRGLIIDEHGIIHMDSYLMNDREFMYSEFAVTIDEEFTNPDVLTAIKSHIDNIEGYIEEMGSPTVLRLSSGPYSNLTITQIRHTSWSILILSGSTTLLDISIFLPILITVLILLIVVAMVTSAANFRLVFLPLGRLEQSLAYLRKSPDGLVSGTNRNDELGELSRTIQDLFTEANIDELTGIYNRRFMVNNLEHIIGMLSRSNEELSVLMLDIDFFKYYNDTYGHEQGDICLRAVAQEMPKCVMRTSDFIARYGGEEFIAILPKTNENGARIVAENLIRSIRALKIPHSGSAVAPYVTVSIGVTTGRVVYEDNWEEFVRCADDALYASKQNGRDRFTFMDMPTRET